MFAAVYLRQLRNAYDNQQKAEFGMPISGAKTDLRNMLDKNFHTTLLALPTLGILIGTLIPLVFMILIAFTNYDRDHITPGNLFTWVGFENFVNLFAMKGTNSMGKTFFSLLGWTLLWAVLATVTTYIGGMILAILINKKGVRFKKIYRGFFVITIAIPQFVSLLVVSKFFSTENGLVNQLLKSWGLITRNIGWFENVTLARTMVVIVNMWIGIPYSMLITSGILMNIPEELYESARIDGAGPVTTFFKITLPYMLFVTGPYLLTQFIGNINNFNVIFLLTGGGSGGATILDLDRNGNDRIKVDLTDAFKEAGIEYNTTLTDAYTAFSDFDADYRKGGTTNAYVDESLKNPAASWYTADRMNQAKNYSKTAVAVISRWGAENVDSSTAQELKSVRGYADGSFLELTAEEKAMFDALEQYDFDVTVVLNTCNDVELGFLEDYDCIKACIFAGIPGQSGAIAIPEIMNGTVNPSGRISDTLPYDHQTYNPTYVNAVKTNSDIVYQEGIYFGYKWYETADAENYFDDVDNKYGKGYDGVVQFPFGFGLSYTTFDWEADFSNVLTLTEKGEYSVTVKVTNTGTVAGKDVVQLYGHAPYTSGGVEKAERVLLDFAKTPSIKPGDSATVTLSFTSYDLASYDAYGNNGAHTGYELDAGEYIISVMKNAHEYNTATPQSANNNGDKGDYKTVSPAKAIEYEKDPVTGKDVDNLFTGNNAYANCPIDGDSNISYLSRKDGFANFPKETATRSGSTPDTNQIKAASKAQYDSSKSTRAFSTVRTRVCILSVLKTATA